MMVYIPHHEQVLILKAQSNHFHHLDRDLRNETKTLREDFQEEMKVLREDFREGMKTMREDLQGEMKVLRGDLREEMKALRGDMEGRFEQVMRRIDRFMFWSLGITVAAAAFVVNYLK